MSFNVSLVAALLLVTCPFASADVRDDICGSLRDDVKDPSTEFTFQDQFTVHVEAVLPEMARIVNSWMRYNSKVKILKINERSTKWDYATYYDYNHLQSLEYDFLDSGRGSCKVIDDTMRERLGFFLVPEPKGAGQAPSSQEVLRLTGASGFSNEDIRLQITEKSVQFRSLGAKQYDSCQKITSSDGSEAIVKVTHFLSNTKLARTEDGTVPLQVIMKGKFVNGHKQGEPVDHTYNFFHYSTLATSEDFQTPQGIVCKGRKTTGEFPPPPAYITFGQEIHNSKDGTVTTVKTVYDKEFQFVVEEFFDDRPGIRGITRLDDFYSGVSYTLNPNTGICNMVNITDATIVNDYIKTPDGKAHMMTPEQFWDNEGIEYHYNGMKHFRGLETDVWIGQDEKTGYMYEWYFMQGIKHSINDHSKSEKTEKHRIPYKRIFWPDINTDLAFSTYYFQVDFTEPPILANLLDCYKHRAKQVYLFVKDLTTERIQKYETLIIRNAVKTLTKALNIHFTRISSPNVFVLGDKGYLDFFLLGRPPYADDIGVDHAKEPTEDVLLEKLKKITEDKKLVFDIGNNDEYFAGEAKFEDLEVQSRSRKGYSAGSMAGLSISMIIIGLAAGGGGGYWFFFKKQ